MFITTGTRWRRYILIVLLVLTGLSLRLTHPVGAQEAQSAGKWVQFDPGGTIPLVALGLSPDWPLDPTILAARSRGDRRNPQERDLVRSIDGGATWVRLADPGFTIDRLIVTGKRPDGRIVFATQWRYSTDENDGALYRSADGGESWQHAFTFSRTSPGDATAPEIIVSPGFETDGIVFAIDSGLLYESRDAGLTWAKVATDSGQRIHQLVFSPAFSRDATIFLALSTGPLTWPMHAPRSMDEPLATAHEQSLGVLRSTDGGASWQQTAMGLEVDGGPFRQVWNLAISPTFDQDRTLFAFSWGPWAPVQSDDGPDASSTSRTVRTGLFRSSDAGETWSAVLVTPASRTLPDGYRATMSLSRDFSSDRWGALNLNWYSLYYRSAQCSVYRTADGGTTWERMPAPEIAATRLCWEFHGGQIGQQRVLLALQPGAGIGGPAVWWISADDGATWNALDFPEPLQYGRIGPIVARDGTIFFGGAGGLWMLGAGASPPGEHPLSTAGDEQPNDLGSPQP